MGQKKEMYRKFLNKLIKEKSISKARRNLVSEKGSRMICETFEKAGVIVFEYESNKKIPQLTEIGKEYLNQLNNGVFENERVE